MWSAYTGRRIYLDANAIIYAIEAQSEERAASRSLLYAIDGQIVRAITSEITMAEVLVKPLETQNTEALAAYDQFVSLDNQVELIPVSRDLVLASAQVSAASKVKLMDAIHVATAKASRCEYFLTHDERLGRTLPTGLQWLRFSDIRS